MSIKRVLSGIQPTSEIHIGNYFGAVANWVKLQDQYECFYTVVDLHAMSMPYKPQDLKRNTIEMFTSLLACGIDPEKSVLFVQSMVPEHSELNWILNCVTSYGELSRMTQFKDKTTLLQEKSKENFVSAALFNYPILQAADILLYKADFVPVGKDQEQHLELSRNIAIRFNNQFGEYFEAPQPLYTKIPKLMSLADPEKKMSKSLGPKHFIGLFDEEKVVRKKVGSAVTDIGGVPSAEMSPGIRNLFEILKACEKQDEIDQLQKDFEAGTLSYKNLKDTVGDALVELTSELIIRRKVFEENPEKVKQILKEGAEKARYVANKTITKVKKRAGLPI
ncbi:MAG: tryptophan--tRNA ligase [Bacteroidetes bacterium]|jgi:tryptophanyl-tRNA synthetase|nr:tryptophan--tRNA ligase [Bacteroidota bacterium]MBT5528142.1 tryptophan--tRNA ligase [Cytophagia bacterium]MBT3802826.1 tryptophan--tRNA ligase [Bacteroidota bacterium]MBT3935506.1 tryptophan--tRNA ligase [Bacteroidota bacterium]MBT4339680.1 tryptophan--tRNA ligase [Bacteroidota bacterium]